MSDSEKVEMLGDVTSLCIKAITDLTKDKSNFQKDIVLAQKGLEMIFESIVEETKARTEAVNVE